jgi:uncharacterized lipoprotein YmbA
MIPRRFIFAAPLLLAGCASPEPAYFTLAARPGAPQPGGLRLVELRRIGLAGYLDRPEIVRTSADYRLHLGAGERWGEPLGALVARVLAEDLNTRLPGTSVFTASGSISAGAGGGDAGPGAAGGADGSADRDARRALDDRSGDGA